MHFYHLACKISSDYERHGRFGFYFIHEWVGLLHGILPMSVVFSIVLSIMYVSGLEVVCRKWKEV